MALENLVLWEGIIFFAINSYSRLMKTNPLWIPYALTLINDGDGFRPECCLAHSIIRSNLRSLLRGDEPKGVFGLEVSVRLL
jgi:hypothetical protein